MDPIAVTGLVAAYFAWKAPTKDDLQRVEDHTAVTAERLQRVHARLDDQHLNDAAISKAQRIPIRVSANGDMT
jgi:hypothetical protein